MGCLDFAPPPHPSSNGLARLPLRRPEWSSPRPGSARVDATDCARRPGAGLVRTAQGRRLRGRRRLACASGAGAGCCWTALRAPWSVGAPRGAAPARPAAAGVGPSALEPWPRDGAARPQAPRAGEPGSPGTRRSPGTAGTPPSPPGEPPSGRPPYTHLYPSTPARGVALSAGLPSTNPHLCAPLARGRETPLRVLLAWCLLALARLSFAHSTRHL